MQPGVGRSIGPGCTEAEKGHRCGRPSGGGGRAFAHRIRAAWPAPPRRWLKHKNLNVLGRYSFTVTQSAGGSLRPRRGPDATELDDDEDGTED